MILGKYILNQKTIEARERQSDFRRQKNFFNTQTPNKIYCKRHINVQFIKICNFFSLLLLNSLFCFFVL